jgi:citrate lyase subunit beta/citryl-CoA lyase
MSPRSRHLPRRSCLSVPASSDKMIAKAATLDADMIFLDLEDSVAATEKAAARARAIAALGDIDWRDKVVGVRVNAWDSPFTVDDLVAIVTASSARLDIVMLPKVQTPGEVEALALILNQLEQSAGLACGRIGIEIQIETARGLVEVERICSASSRLEAVHLGPGDMAASLEMPVISGGVHVLEYPGDHFHYVFSRILVAARAHGLQALDGPYFRIKDLQGLRDYTQRSRVLGFDGKWALHPDQVAIINELFSPTPEQFERACALLDAYEQATAVDGRGAIWFDSEMIDEASRKMAAKFVARGERAGLIRSGTTRAD